MARTEKKKSVLDEQQFLELEKIQKWFKVFFPEENETKAVNQMRVYSHPLL
jgi:hypothetical protein